MPRGLYDGDEGANDSGLTLKPTNSEPTKALTARQTADYLARAANGERETLLALYHAREHELYRRVLGELTKRATKDTNELRALTAFIIDQRDLRADVALVCLYRELWRDAPDCATTADLLRLSASADDAAEFQQTAEVAWQAQREGRIAGMSADDLRALGESEFWVLSDNARRTGAGFVLKQWLADARQETPSLNASSADTAAVRNHDE